MSGQYVGEIRLFPYNFAPKTWAYCAGQLLPIAQNQALFALLGTTYGGNGVQNFALPDLRGRAVVGSGNQSPWGPVPEGLMSGSENVTLLQSSMPMHNHLWTASSADATAGGPVGNYYAAADTGAAPGTPINVYTTTLTGGITLAPTTIGSTGGSLPHPNMQPYQVLAYCVALYGIFPSRN